MSELSDSIIQLHEEGLNYTQIKERLGCSKGTISYYLGEGQKNKTAERQRDRRNRVTKYIQNIKQSNACADCKENYPYWIMQFDHVRGEKLFNISNYHFMVSSFDKIKEEIEKCDIVCANCHATRTYSRLLKTNASTMDLAKFYE